jgi:hypothetical protein
VRRSSGTNGFSDRLRDERDAFLAEATQAEGVPFGHAGDQRAG